MENLEKTAIISQKRKITDSEESSNEPAKKSINETHSLVNETKATGTHVDENKILGSPANDTEEYFDTPVKSLYDKNEYRAFKLRNGFKALLISAPYPVCSKKGEQERESDVSCGLCIDVGKFSDPSGVPYIIKYLKHMVSNGSEKYSTQSNYWMLTANSSGYLSTIIGSDQTVFTMNQVKKSHLEEALDRMAQFFIRPLISRDDLPGVREYVESCINVQHPRGFDSEAKEKLFGRLAQPDHPATKFYQGQCTLTDDNLYRELIEFKEKHYSAHRMTLVLEARYPLNTLEEYVKKSFSSISNNGLPTDDFSHFTDPLNNSAISRIYKMSSYEPMFNVEMRWPLPAVYKNYRTKPYQYITRILQYRGKGSLFRYLEKKKWCYDIICRMGKKSFENNSLYSTLILSLQVTEIGKIHLWEVFDTVYSYITLLKKADPQKLIYDQIQKVAAAKFRFRSKNLDEDIFERCTRARLYWGSAACITGSEYYYNYDTESINTCTNLLNPERVTIIYHESSPAYSKTIGSEPEFIKTSESLIERWKAVTLKPELHLPEVNAFINENNPVMIHTDAFSEIWFKHHRPYMEENSTMYIHYMTCLPLQSAHHANMLNLFVSTFEGLLSNKSWWFSCKIHPGPNGLWMEASGDAQRLACLMKMVTVLMAQCSHLFTKDSFDEMKQKLLESYYNDLKDPNKLAGDLENVITNPVHRAKIDLYSVHRALQFGQFQDFVKQLTGKMRIQCFVHGTMMTPDIIETIETCVKILSCEPLLPNSIPQDGTNKIPAGVRCCRVKSLDKSCLDSVVLNHYQFKAPSTRMIAIIDIFCNFVNAQQNKEKYRVANCNPGQFGYSLTSKASKSETVKEIDKNIEVFRNHINVKFKEMQKADLIALKKCLIEELSNRKAEIDEDHPQKKTNGTWLKIMKGGDFNEEQRKLDLIDAMSIEDLKSWFVVLSSNVINRTHNKLSIQVVGHDSPMKESTSARTNSNTQSTQDSIEFSLEYLTDMAGGKNPSGENDYYINDHNRFKHHLTCYLKGKRPT